MGGHDGGSCATALGSVRSTGRSATTPIPTHRDERDPHRHAYTDPDGNPDGNGHRDGRADQHADHDGNTESHAYIYHHSDAVTHSDAIENGETFENANTFAHAYHDTFADCDVISHRHQHAVAEPDSPANGNVLQ